jgi:Domain of unknown function (DUF6438)
MHSDISVTRVFKCILLITSAFSIESCSNLTSSTSALPSKTVPAQISSITLETLGCRGNCPDYKIKILVNGKVSYEGYKFVKVKGNSQSVVTKSKIQSLNRAIDELQLLSFDSEKDGCISQIADSGGTRIVIAMNDKKERVFNIVDCDGKYSNEVYRRRLTLFENKVKSTVNLSQWTGKP